jgi:hypothetical protein
MIKAFFEVDFPELLRFEENGQVIGNDTMENMVFIISYAERVKKLEKYVNLGFTDIALIKSSSDREKLVKLLSEKVIPLVNNRATVSSTDSSKKHKERPMKSYAQVL